MQTLTITMPQDLRVQLQEYQNSQGIEQPEAAIVAALQAYFATLVQPSNLPPMYDAEDGPCEVLDSFLCG
jgi:hypothetical protein